MSGRTNLVLRANPWKVVDLAILKRDGKIHLPDLQRGFVWTPEKVRALYDSLYRRYPVGALLLWKPTWEGEQVPFSTRGWELFPPNSATGRGAREPDKEVHPGALFVLDGQQRLTSLFRVIFRSHLRDRTTLDPDILVALSPKEEWVEEPFHQRSKNIVRKMREGLLVPAGVLFEGIRGGNESLAVQRAIGEWVTPTDDLFFQALDRANTIRTSILQSEIVAYEIDADAEDDRVIEIFARLNQQGVRLRPADLAAARLTGHMAEFRKRARVVLQSPDLAGFSVQEGTEERSKSGAFVDTDLLIRASLFLGAGTLRYRDVEKRGTEAGTAYKKVEENWELAAKGFKDAVALFRSAGIQSASWLPYRHLLVPLAIASAKSQTLKSQWLAWAILASIWRHYGGESETKLQKDCGLAQAGDLNGLVDHVKTRAKRIESAIPEVEDFTESIVGEEGVHLALLVHFARNQGRSFPGGKFIATADESLERHHLFPQALLNSDTYRDSQFVPDRLGNFTLITRADNEHLSDMLPEDYLPDLSAEARRVHLIPEDRSLWRVENFAEFCSCREEMIAQTVRGLIDQLLKG